MNNYIKIVLLFLSIFSTSLYSYSATDYVTVWETTSDNESVVIPTYPSISYDYDVDCDNDGVFEQTGVTGDATCTYASAGEHTIVIKGAYLYVYINNGASKEKIKEIKQWGTILWVSLEDAYYGASNLNITATDAPNLTYANGATFAFHSTDLSTATNINNWDMSNIEYMAGMFMRSSFNSNVSDWNVSKVNDMTFVFAYTPFNQNINNWDMSNVSNLYGMFAYSSFAQNIGDWDVSKVENMSYIFAYTPFNQNINNWDTVAVSDMHGAFAYSSFNQDIGDWDVSNVENMSAVFAYSPFNQDIGDWDVSNVESLESTFSGSDFDQDISSWDVRNVTNIDDIFAECEIVQDISMWQLDSVDENGDGVKDGDQVNVATNVFTKADGTPSFVTAISSDGTIAVTTSAEESPSSNFTAPYGKFKIDITAIPFGSDQTITLFFNDDLEITQILKYNRVSANYEVYPTDSIVHDEVNKQIIITYTVQNGGNYDLDASDNAAIYDPIIPVIPAPVAVPISDSRYMFFALAILLIGLRQVMRR